MRWLIVNTEAFTPKGIKGNKEFKELDKSFLPKFVQWFLTVFHYPYIILDESSKIKTNTPMVEYKKSSRCRTIKLLNDVGERSIMTGTLKSKSPLNVYDQYGFLDPGIIGEDMFTMAEEYCVMETIHVGRGRRVLISQKDYDRVRTRLINAWKRDGDNGIRFCKTALFKEFAIRDDCLDWIMAHKTYTPFMNQGELDRRLAPYTMRVNRRDVFDISLEKFVHEPIVRYVEPTVKQKKLMSEFIDLGFTDSFTLGKAASLELYHRLQDVCNGFNPVLLSDPADPKRVIDYKLLEESPKLDGLMELIDEIGPDENQIVIYSARTNFTEAIMRSLTDAEISFVHYEGTTAEKNAAAEAFKRKKARVFLSNIQPAAFGLNALADADYIIYACADYKTETFYQSQHRILRGQLTRRKFAYMIAVRGSVEERLMRSLRLGVELIGGEATRETFEPIGA